MTIADWVIVMHAGSVEQIDTPNEIYDTPRNAFIADFVGAANLIRVQGIMHSVEWILFMTCRAAKLGAYVVQSKYWCSAAYCIAY